MRFARRPSLSLRTAAVVAPLSRCVGIATCMLVATLAACDRESRTTPAATQTTVTSPQPRWCDHLPRAANAAVREANVRSEWYTVYEVDSNVYAFVEAKQFQEAISYLIVGDSSALLWDSGIGLVPLRPVVEQITRLPVRVMNSHTHFDHVGANHEFDRVLAMDTPFTRRNEQGRPHAGLASEVMPQSFCGVPPVSADTAGFRSRGWQVTRRVQDGDTLDLGGRVIELLATPGHTPDAAMLLDRTRGLLFTGDSYYDSTLWLFMPETDLAAYQRSMERVATLAPRLTWLLPAHNTVREPPARLANVAAAVRTMRAGGGERTAGDDGEVQVRVGDVTFMTSIALLPAPSAGAKKSPQAP